jgi:hypothetical protein
LIAEVGLTDFANLEVICDVIAGVFEGVPSNFFVLPRKTLE